MGMLNAVPAKQRPPQRTQVLYVEDEDPNWEVALFGLRDAYNLVRARNAQEAAAILAKGGFDAILMDVQLCGSTLDGIALTRVIKGLDQCAELGTCAYPDLPVIFVTAFGERYDRAVFSAAGGEEVIAKPVDFTTLTLALSRVLVRRARQQQPATAE